MTPADSVHSTPPTNTSVPLEQATESTRALETGLAIQQRERETALRTVARLRKEASAEIERLLAFMDASDPYASNELEDAVDDGPCDDRETEPSLGWTDTEAKTGRIANPGDTDAELDNCDDEPSLGGAAWSEWSNQENWAKSRTDDLEDEHDGAEPDVSDLEPSLGWTVDGCTTGNELGRYDREQDVVPA